MLLKILSAAPALVLCVAAIAANASGETVPMVERAAPGATAAPAGAPDPFAQTIAARTVADFARRQHDAGAMITAARMLQEVPFAGGEESKAGFTPAGLFEEAKQLARGDRLILLQIQVAQSTGSRGVSMSVFGKGLVRSVQTVNPRAGYQFTVRANGGEPLRVGAIGDVGTALAMRMRDTGNRVVCLDDNGDYGPVCQLTPKTAAQYRVEIVNKSAVSSRAVILSN